MHTAIGVALAFTGLAFQPAPGGVGPPDEVKAVVARGLDYLAKQQNADGSWAGVNGGYPTALTALAGTALLAQGSTPREGKYSRELVKAIRWCEKQAQPSGLISSREASEQGRYLLGHGFALMFLAMTYGEEEDATRRKALAAILDKAVAFTAKAQTTRGGWGYVSAQDGSDFDEGHSTIVVVHGLRAARAAGIHVPKEMLDKADKYFADSTARDGGIVYSLAAGAGGGGRPVLTAGVAALAAPRGPIPERHAGWVKLASRGLNPDLGRTRDSHLLLGHWYFARVAYHLGNDGHKKLDPTAGEADLVRWGDYRKTLFGSLKGLQAADGSWPDSTVGPSYATALALTILQLENEAVPFFGR